MKKELKKTVTFSLVHEQLPLYSFGEEGSEFIELADSKLSEVCRKADRIFERSNKS